MQKRNLKTVGIISILLFVLLAATSGVWAQSPQEFMIGVQYRGHIENQGNMPQPEGSFIIGPAAFGTTGQGLRLEGLFLELTGELPQGAAINYQVHVANQGWLDPVKNGAFAGTQGQGLPLEAIKIWLTGLDGYDVYYRGHVQNKGNVPIKNNEWGWLKNGDLLGTTGQGLRLEAIEVKIVPNDWPQDILAAPTDLSATVVGKQTLKLSWSDSLNADSYSVYQADSADGAYVQIAQAVTEPSYSVEGLKSGQTYYFKVAADGDGFTSSDLSAPVSAIADVDRQGDVYFGSSLLVMNTSLDFTASQATGNLPPGVSTQSVGTDQSAVIEDGKIDAVVPFEATPETHFITSSDGADYAQTQAVVGDTASFWVSNFATDSFDQLDAKCVYNQGNVEIWVDNTTDQSGNLAVPVESQLSQDQIEALGQEYNTHIHQQMTDNFGQLPVVNGSSKETILVYDVQDNFESSGVFNSGYFKPLDLTDEEQSNHRSMIYLDTYPSMTSDPESPAQKEVSLNYTTMAHELQHAINYNTNVIKQGGTKMADCLDEAFAMAAEDLLYGTQYDRINYFKRSATVQKGLSPLVWQDDQEGDVLSSYAMSYVFAMYLEAQAQTPAVFKAIIDAPGDDFFALQSVVYQEIDPSLSIVDLLINFRIALMISADSGPYGFSGNPDFDDVRPLVYTGDPDALNLLGGGAIVIAIPSSPFTDDPTDQGPDIQMTGVFTPSQQEIDQQNKERVIARINEKRQAAGLVPLIEDLALDQAAAIRAQEAAVLFSHDRPNGQSLQALINEVGISNFTKAGENITKNYASPEFFVKTINQKKIMDEDYTKIGFGTYMTGDESYWTLVYLED